MTDIHHQRGPADELAVEPQVSAIASPNEAAADVHAQRLHDLLAQLQQQRASSASDAALAQQARDEEPADIAQLGEAFAELVAHVEAMPFLAAACRALAQASETISAPEKLRAIPLHAFFTDIELRRLVMCFCDDEQALELFDAEDGRFELMEEARQRDAVRPLLAQIGELDGGMRNAVDEAKLALIRELIASELGGGHDH